MPTPHLPSPGKERRAVDRPVAGRGWVDAIADPNHEEHAESLQWIGGHFDPTDANVEAIAQAVQSLAKKWTRRPSARNRS